MNVVLLLIALFVGHGFCSDPECVDEYGDPMSRGPFEKEGDCEKYHTCSNGQLIVSECPDGLAFDPSLGVCNHAIQVYGCEHLAGVDPNLSGYCKNEDGTAKDPQPPPTRVPETCDSYYYCSNGVMGEQKCQPGLVFNPDVGSCDYESNSPYCVPGTTPPSGTTTTPKSTSGTSTVTPATTKPTDPLTSTTNIPPNPSTTTKTSSTTTMTSTDAVIISTTTSSVPGTTTLASVAHPECVDEYGNPISKGPFEKEGECDKYHTCSDGQLIVSECPDGLAFDPSLGVCNHAIQVYGCEHLAGVDPNLSGYCKNEDGTAKDPQPPPTRVPETCDSYYYCSNGVMGEQKCQPGLVFNPDVGGCDYESNSPYCVPGTTPPSPETTTTPKSTSGTSTVTPATTKPTDPLTSTTNIPLNPSTTTKTSSTTTMTTTDAVIISTTTSSVPGTTTLASVAALTYLGFVVDDTGSMSNEIVGVKQWITNCVNGLYADCATLPTGGWLMTSFNDPLSQNGPVIGPTTDVKVIINAIDNLSAHGGGDCPEYAFTGLEKAVDAIPDDAGACKIFFYTDALAKDESMAEAVRQKYSKKGCSFIPLLTRCCSECEDPPEYYRAIDGRAGHTGKRKRRSASVSGENAYYMLANKTGGTIFLTDKPSSPDELLEFLEEEVTLGFCPTTLIAGPPPNGYTNENDCNLTRSCWDRSMDKCFCMSETEPCPKDPIAPNCKMDEEHSYLPDPTDCAKFYQCSFGNIWRKDCAEGTVFDPAVGTCNHPYDTAPPCGTKVVE